jgi:DNA mismatch repair ATPase MutS
METFKEMMVTGGDYDMNNDNNEEGEEDEQQQQPSFMMRREEKKTVTTADTGQFIPLYKLKYGIEIESEGIRCSATMGISELVIKRAKEIKQHIQVGLLFNTIE